MNGDDDRTAMLLGQMIFGSPAVYSTAGCLSAISLLREGLAVLEARYVVLARGGSEQPQRAQQAPAKVAMPAARKRGRKPRPQAANGAAPSSADVLFPEPVPAAPAEVAS